MSTFLSSLWRALRGFTSRPLVTDQTGSDYHSPYTVHLHNGAFGQRTI